MTTPTLKRYTIWAIAKDYAQPVTMVHVSYTGEEADQTPSARIVWVGWAASRVDALRQSYGASARAA